MKSDRIISIVFILISGWLWVETKRLQYNCAIFPKFSALFLIVLSLLLFMGTFFKQKQTSERRSPLKRKDLIYITIITLLALAWIYLMNIIGFVTSSITFTTIMTLVLSAKTPKFREFLSTLVLYTIIAVGFWFALAKLLLVPLPQGFLF